MQKIRCLFGLHEEEYYIHLPLFKVHLTKCRCCGKKRQYFEEKNK